VPIDVGEPMSMADTLSSVADLVSAIVWPLVVVVLALVLLTGARGKGLLEWIKGWFEGAERVKLGPLEVERKVDRAVRSTLSVAAAEMKQRPPDQVLNPASVDRISHAVTSAVMSDLTQRPAILWVDDQPDNNVSERRALEQSLGANFTLSTSTEDAMQRLERGRFNVVISNMGRPGDRLAGYTLLDRMRPKGHEQPVVIYSMGVEEQHKRAAMERGAWGETDRPNELIDLVTSACAKVIPPTT
jgi:CheY-like chemotaxis protein